MNELANEKSAYLKHAADQKIDWLPWSEKAFKKAKDEDKPVFLSSGAVWCHWCHVMAKECFYDDDIAGFLNSNYVCIKLDRDERPSIDRRYQMAVSAMNSGGGWPLTVFLTPDKKPFYGGTYFPPEDKLGRPGLKKVLKTIDSYYKTNRAEITEYSGRVINAITAEPLNEGEINALQLNDAVNRIISECDKQNGGFGSAPKFPMPGAIDFLINRYVITRDESIRHCIEKTLKSMADGGMYDHLGDGFHRYSTDDYWIIPHFEKMAEDNSWLMRNYLNAYAVFEDDRYKSIVEGIIRFTMNVLADSKGGFYSSQDADITPDDEGGYFIWTDDDFRRVLTGDEYRVMSLYLMNEKGAMHHDSSKRVLFINRSVSEIAEEIGRGADDIADTIQHCKNKLLEERNKRECPYIDNAIYTSINGMYIASFLKACDILADNEVRDFALKSLDRLINTNVKNGLLYHTEDVKALLDDYIYLIEALLAAYETTGKTSYMESGDAFMEECINKLWDNEEGGFMDSEDHVLGVKVKGIQDSPHPAANSLSILLLLKLFVMTGKSKYYQYAEKALKTFSPIVKDMGVHAGFYYSALDAYFNCVKLELHTKPESELSLSARSVFVPYLNVLYRADEGYALVCFRETCYDPLKNGKELQEFLREKIYVENI
jgi:uncharacterized protein YyaL (SSP411 family)